MRRRYVVEWPRPIGVLNPSGPWVQMRSQQQAEEAVVACISALACDNCLGCWPKPGQVRPESSNVWPVSGNTWPISWPNSGAIRPSMLNILSSHGRVQQNSAQTWPMSDQIWSAAVETWLDRSRPAIAEIGQRNSAEIENSAKQKGAVVDRNRPNLAERQNLINSDQIWSKRPSSDQLAREMATQFTTC